jgi:type VI secretion system protein ImpC
MDTGDALGARPAPAIDIDDFDDVLERLNVEARLSLDPAAPPLAIRFTTLEDFHPDQLFDRLPAFDSLRELRKAARDPTTFAAAAAKAGLLPGGPTVSPAGPAAHAAPPPTPSPSDFEALLRGPISGPAPARPGAGSGFDIEAFIRRIIQPHIVAAPSPRQTDVIAAIDRALSDLMRCILHHPGVQSLEAAWRAVHFLITTLETGETLSIHLIDISKTELAADLGAPDLSRTGLFKLLVEKAARSPGVVPWGLLLGNFTFDATREDAELLGRLAKVCAAAGTPFVAGASSRLVQCDSFARTPDPDHWNAEIAPDAREAWAALRRLSETAFIGLALPRFLLRAPYGAAADPIERFAFEELPECTLDSHERYLWANPAFAVAATIGCAFAEDGWALDFAIGGEVGGLPVHTWREGGEVRAKPCAEAWLTEKAAAILRGAGLIPVHSIRGRDAVRVAGIASIAEGGGGLRGRWL